MFGVPPVVPHQVLARLRDVHQYAGEELGGVDGLALIVRVSRGLVVGVGRSRGRVVTRAVGPGLWEVCEFTGWGSAIEVSRRPALPRARGMVALDQAGALASTRRAPELTFDSVVRSSREKADSYPSRRSAVSCGWLGDGAANDLNSIDT